MQERKVANDPWSAAGFRPLGSEEEPQQASPAASEFESVGLRRVEATPAEKRGAVAQGFSAGLQQGGMSAIGMTAGGMLGAPLGPVGVAAGAALGGTAGYQIGRIMSDYTTVTERELPPSLRPWYAGGEIVGGGLPYAAAPIAIGKTAARLPASSVGNFVNRILDTAGKNPGSFLATELPSLGSAAVAGGTATAYMPDNAFARFGAEVLGGMFNPARMLGLALQSSKFGLSKVLGAFSKTGRENSAQKLLKEIINEAGEDPAVIARLLRDPVVAGATETAAQKSGSQALAAVEAMLSKRSFKFGAEVQTRTENSLGALKSMVALLRRTGDPEMLRQAALVRNRQYTATLQGLIKGAETDAIEAASKISAETSVAKGQISTQAREALDTVLSAAREAESELWGKIPGEFQIRAGSFIKQFDNIMSDMLPEQRFPTGKDLDLPALVERLRGVDGVTSVSELLKVRSVLLSKARQAASGMDPDWNQARILGQLADAAIDDLGRIQMRQPNGRFVSPSVVDDAREFSKALNDTFSRNFTGKSLGTITGGSEKLPPELLLRRALAAGQEAAELQFQQLESATRFLQQMDMSTAQTDQAIEQMLEAQERFLRLTAAEAIDPRTGRASAQRLSTILKKQSALFERFPEVRDTVQAAIKSEDSLAHITDVATSTQRIVNQEAAFAKLAKVENPVDVIGKALRGSNPVKQLRQIDKLAKRGGPDAIKGFKSSILDYAMQQGGPELDFNKVKAALFNPIREGQPSLADIAVEAGAFDAAEVENLTKIFEAAERITKSASGRADLIAMAEEVDGITDLLLRIQGAKLGTAIGGAGPAVGHGLIAAQAGSSFLRKFFEKMTINSSEKILREAALNPELMALMLEKPATPARSLQLGRQIHAYLLNAGFHYLTETGDQPEGQLQ